MKPFQRYLEAMFESCPLRIVGLLGGLILLGGCWQEIRYDPSAKEVAQNQGPSPATDTREASNPADVSPPVDPDTSQNVTEPTGTEDLDSEGVAENLPTEETSPGEAVTADEDGGARDEQDETSIDELFGEIDRESDIATSAPPAEAAEVETSSMPIADQPPDASSPTEADETFDELFGPSEEPSQMANDEAMNEGMAESAESTPPADDAAKSSPSRSTSEESIGPDRLPPSRTALAAWRMASRWSLAAALYAKEVDESVYQPNWDQATYAADLLGLKLPPLPESADDLQTEVITYLMRQGREELAIPLTEKFSSQYPALVELAVKSNILLLVYTPRSDQLEPLITDIARAAAASGLPEELWRSLADQLESRAEFAEVKKSVLQLHAAVTDYLAGAPSLETTGPHENQP